jgi:hypothetical protein
MASNRLPVLSGYAEFILSGETTPAGPVFQLHLAKLFVFQGNVPIRSTASLLYEYV